MYSVKSRKNLIYGGCSIFFWRSYNRGLVLNGYQKDIPDPAKVEGSKVKINTAFEAVFNQLKQRIEKELLS